MKTINVLENDLAFEVIEGKMEIKQCLEIELGSALNEWFADTSYGHKRDVFTEKPLPEELELEVARVIANEPRVRLVGGVNVEVEKASRTAFITFVVEEIATGETWEQEVEV